MKPWTKRQIGPLTVCESSGITWLPGVVHCFSTRTGGSSEGPYKSLNLGADVGDKPSAVAENQELFRRLVGGEGSRLVTCSQVHGNAIAFVTADDEEPPGEADGMVTNVPGILLGLTFADCVPIFAVEPVKRVVGIAHSGWRGTARDIASKLVIAMTDRYGAMVERIQVGVGPSIGADRYIVDSDVAAVFRNLAVGQAVSIFDEFLGKYSVDLRQVVYHQLLEAGIVPDAISVSQDCTYSMPHLYYSARRENEAGRATGRMMGVIGLS
jgi:hypothetical protein